VYVSQFTAMRPAAAARVQNTERFRSAAPRTRHALVTVIRRAQKISDQTTRLATISTALAGCSTKKYSGSSPQSP